MPKQKAVRWLPNGSSGLAPPLFKKISEICGKGLDKVIGNPHNQTDKDKSVCSAGRPVKTTVNQSALCLCFCTGGARLAMMPVCTPCS